MRSRHGALVIAACLLISPATTSLFAQVDRAVLEGTVTDQTGAAIVGARVKALAVGTGITEEQRTNARGYYFFPGLAVGRYGKHDE